MSRLHISKKRVVEEAAVQHGGLLRIDPVEADLDDGRCRRLIPMVSQSFPRDTAMPAVADESAIQPQFVGTVTGQGEWPDTSGFKKQNPFRGLAG
jgi:hypothetical protein